MDENIKELIIEKLGQLEKNWKIHQVVKNQLNYFQKIRNL